MTDKTLDTTTERPEGQHLHLGWALVLISVAQLMVVLDGTIANIALPYIQADLGFSDADLTWVVTVYALAFGGLLLLGGRLGDLYGRRLTFMIGLSVFAIASLLGGIAETPAMLLGARALQGAGAALAAPAALALITTTFPAGPAAQPGLRRVRRDVGRRCGRRADPRRLAHRLHGGAVRHDDRRLATHLLDQRPDRAGRCGPRPARARRVRDPPGAARRPRGHHRHPRPVRHRLRPVPRRPATAGPTRGPWSRSSAAWACWCSSGGSRAGPPTRFCRSASSATAPGRPASRR